MSRRGLVGIAIVLAWAGGLAAFARRELTQTEAERLAESALRVAPGATHFAVLRNGRHVGYASNTIDTLPARIQVTDYLVAEASTGGGDSLRRTTHRTRVRLTRGLALRDFLVTLTTDSVPLLMRGRVLNDTILEYVARVAKGSRGRTLDSARSVMRARIIAEPLLPMITLLDGPVRVGRVADFESLDPVSGKTRRAQVRLAAESLFVVADSAAYDTEATKWRSVHNDTVRAWRLDGVPGTVWVDALGRAVRHERPDGYTLQRTAYELAFENWRATSALNGEVRGQRSQVRGRQ
jgi:hypothetical protein